MIAPRDLATFLGIPPHTLDQWRSQGLGPAWHRIGRHVRYAWADIEQWLGQQRHGGARTLDDALARELKEEIGLEVRARRHWAPGAS